MIEVSRFFKILLAVVILLGCSGCGADVIDKPIPAEESDSELTIVLENPIGKGKSYVFKLVEGNRFTVYCGSIGVNIDTIVASPSDNGGNSKNCNISSKIENNTFFDKIEKQATVVLTDSQSREVSCLLRKVIEEKPVRDNRVVYDDYRIVYFQYSDREEWFYPSLLDRKSGMQKLLDKLKEYSPFKIRFESSFS